MLEMNPDSTRNIDVIWAPLAIGAAGSLLILAFQKKLEALRDKSPIYLVIPAFFLIFVGMGLIRTRLVDIAIPLPVLRVTITKLGTTRLIQSSIIASGAILFAVMGAPRPIRALRRAQQADEAGWPSLFGRDFVGLIWIEDVLITQVRYLYASPAAHATFLIWSVLIASCICKFANGNLDDFKEWKTRVMILQSTGSIAVSRSGKNRAYGIYYLSHVFRVLSLVVVWTAMILQMWV